MAFLLEGSECFNYFHCYETPLILVLLLLGNLIVGLVSLNFLPAVRIAKDTQDEQ